MKKFIISLAVILGFASLANAQSLAVSFVPDGETANVDGSFPLLDRVSAAFRLADVTSEEAGFHAGASASMFTVSNLSFSVGALYQVTGDSDWMTTTVTSVQVSERSAVAVGLDFPFSGGYGISVGGVYNP